MATTDWKQIAEAVNQALSAARWSSQDLANKAGVDRKTVDRLRQGRAVRTQTLTWIEQALKISLSEGDGVNPDVAPADFGGYRKDAVISYAGEYIALRRSFDQASRIIASFLEIYWDERLPALRFHESQENRLASGKTYAYEFGGDVLMPPNLGVMNLTVRSNDGRVRLISTSMPRDENGILMMKGFILTLNEIQHIGYYPVCSPILIRRQSSDEPLQTGVIDPSDVRYNNARSMLDEIEQRFLPGD